jgi:hypothetical protein
MAAELLEDEHYMEAAVPGNREQGFEDVCLPK